MRFAIVQIFAVAAFAVLPGLAVAQPVYEAPPGQVAPPSSHPPIHVEECNPRGGTAPSVSYVGPAFYGFAPVGPLGFTDVYGNYITQPGVSPELSINYKNVTDKVAKKIDFGLVARGVLVAEVRDVGKFSPNVTIKHTFGLSPNVFPLGTGLPQCVALHVDYMDGTHWKNPHLPQLKASAGIHSHHQ